jgi:DNA replication protein DnaC
MNPASLDILRYQIEELGLSFILGNIDTFLHRESNSQRPLLETLSDLFDHEISQRKQRAAKTRLKISNLPVIKTLEEFDPDQVEGVSRKDLNELATLTFIERKENIVIMGPSGLGKSHILYGLCHKACMEGYTAYHLSCQDLMEKLKKAKQQNRLSRKISSLCKPRVLAIDEIGYQNLTAEEAPLFFQLVAERYEKGPIIITTNKVFGQWGELMGENAIATATLDRLLHHAQVFVMKGESYRIKNRINLGLVHPLKQ